MSLLIKGMEMPTSFEECQTVLGCCDAFEDGTVWCRLAHGYIGDERTVCPIVPVPPHGRLIDADAVMGKLQKQRWNYQMLDDSQTADKIMHGLFRAEQIINDAPTVIPAEEGE